MLGLLYARLYGQARSLTTTTTASADSGSADHQDQNHVRSVCGGLVPSLTGELMSSERCLRLPSVGVVAVRFRCHALVRRILLGLALASGQGGAEEADLIERQLEIVYPSRGHRALAGLLLVGSALRRDRRDQAAEP